MRARTQHERVLHAAHTRTSCAWRARRAWRHAVRDSTFCLPPPFYLFASSDRCMCMCVWVTRRMMRTRMREMKRVHLIPPTLVTLDPHLLPTPSPGILLSLEILPLSPCQPYSTLRLWLSDAPAAGSHTRCPRAGRDVTRTPPHSVTSVSPKREPLSRREACVHARRTPPRHTARAAVIRGEKDNSLVQRRQRRQQRRCSLPSADLWL